MNTLQNILAIDTCTEVCSVSLHTQGENISHFVKDVAKSSSLILPMCDTVFKQANVSVADLDVIVYSKGPGAFTGVRMCVSVAQSMSLAYDIPTIGYSTLEMVGAGAVKKYNINKIAVALDARMNEIYWGIYEDGLLTTERLLKPNEADVLSADFIGVGTGWGVYKDELIQRTNVHNFVANFYPKAENLITMYLNQKTAFDSKLALPTYLRDNVAKKTLV